MRVLFKKYALTVLSSVLIIFGAFNGYAGDEFSSKDSTFDAGALNDIQEFSTPVKENLEDYISGSGYGYGSSHGYGFAASDDSESACGLALMKKKYLSSDAVESSCWYCKIVIVLTNAYLKVAAQAIPTSVALGKIILKYGFLIWLAYYILQQVSSMKAITPGKSLQEILVMGLKVAVASLILDSALPFITEYLLNPIIGFGTDYGIQILNGILR